jgi:hydroxyacylglutathione hydrolase
MGGKLIKDEWFSAYYIVNDIWRISDGCQDNIYLVLGNNAALLLDTGWGVGNLKAFAARISALPLVVANTHGHVDHALGNDSFDSVYIGDQDARKLNRRDVQEKRSFIKNNRLLTEIRETPNFDLWGTAARKQNRVIRDMMDIDLGGRTVTARLTPGHTAGSVCFLDKRSRVLFTGDSFVPFAAWGPMWFHLKESTPLSVYYERMSSIVAAGGFDYLLSGHGERGLIPASALTTLLHGIRDIMDRKITGTPESTFAGDGLRIDWRGVSIVYDPEKIGV